MSKVQKKLDFRMNFGSKDVPWSRKGSPSKSDCNFNSIKWGSQIANVGAYRNRLYSDEQILQWARDKPNHGAIIFGIEERSFAMLWDYENNARPATTPILEHLLNNDVIRPFIKDAENRYLAELVAQSVVQWLGTNVGSCFINKARRISEVKHDELKAKCQNICNRAEIAEVYERVAKNEDVIKKKEQEIHELRAEIASFDRDLKIQLEEALEERRQADLDNTKGFVHKGRDIDLDEGDEDVNK